MEGVLFDWIGSAIQYMAMADYPCTDGALSCTGCVLACHACCRRHWCVPRVMPASHCVVQTRRHSWGTCPRGPSTCRAPTSRSPRPHLTSCWPPFEVCASWAVRAAAPRTVTPLCCTILRDLPKCPFQCPPQAWSTSSTTTPAHQGSASTSVLAGPPHLRTRVRPGCVVHGLAPVLASGYICSRPPPLGHLALQVDGTTKAARKWCVGPCHSRVAYRVANAGWRAFPVQCGWRGGVYGAYGAIPFVVAACPIPQRPPPRPPMPPTLHRAQIMPIGQYGPPSDFFPPAPWNLSADVEACVQTYGVVPRSDWIRIVYGGKGMQVGRLPPSCMLSAW